MAQQGLEQRVRRVADAALAGQQFVSAIDVLVGLGWLASSHLDRWRQGRLELLEGVLQVNPGKVTAAMTAFRHWADDRELKPSETEYIARTRDRRPLRFSVSGDAAVEQAYRTHWVSPRPSQRAVTRQSRPTDTATSAVRSPQSWRLWPNLDSNSAVNSERLPARRAPGRAQGDVAN
jgi:hypothetical protein